MSFITKILAVELRLLVFVLVTLNTLLFTAVAAAACGWPAESFLFKPLGK